MDIPIISKDVSCVTKCIQYMLDTYGVLSVIDLYDLIEWINPLWEKPRLEVENFKIGWTEDYIQMHIKDTIGGQYVELNKPIPLQ